MDSEGLGGLGDIWGIFGEHFGYLFGTFGGFGEDLFGTFRGSGAYLEANTSKKGEGNFGIVAFGPEKWPQGFSKTLGKAPKLRPRGCQEAKKRAFERKTSKP